MQQQPTEVASISNDQDAIMTRESFLAALQGETPTQGEEAPDTGKPAVVATPETGTEAGGDPTEKPSLETLNDLAETLGIEVKDLYGIKFRSGEGEGESHTLGELKDLLAKQEDFSARTLELDERRVAQENELLRAKQDIETILSAIPKGSLRPDVLEKARAERVKVAEAERERLLEVVPEWSDDEREAADRSGMVEHLKQYGYGKGDLDRIIDHRMVKYVRDNWAREQRVAKALKGVKEVKNPPSGQRRSTPGQPPRKASSTPATPALTSGDLRSRFANL